MCSEIMTKLSPLLGLPTEVFYMILQYMQSGHAIINILEACYFFFDGRPQYIVNCHTLVTACHMCPIFIEDFNFRWPHHFRTLLRTKSLTLHNCKGVDYPLLEPLRRTLERLDISGSEGNFDDLRLHSLLHSLKYLNVSHTSFRTRRLFECYDESCENFINIPLVNLVEVDMHAPLATSRIEDVDILPFKYVECLDVSGTSIRQMRHSFVYEKLHTLYARKCDWLDSSNMDFFKNVHTLDISCYGRCRSIQLSLLPNLRTLIARECKLDKIDFSNTTLDSVDLSKCDLYRFDFACLSETRKICFASTLFLTDNHLSSLKCVQVLDLSKCNSITDRGLAHFRGLSLEAIDLSGVYQITDNGLEHLRGVKRISVSFWTAGEHVTNGRNGRFGCCITDRGLAAIAGAKDVRLCFRPNITEKGIWLLEGVETLCILERTNDSNNKFIGTDLLCHLRKKGLKQYISHDITIYNREQRGRQVETMITGKSWSLNLFEEDFRSCRHCEKHASK